MKLVITEKNSVEGYTAAWVAKRMLKNDCEIVQVCKGDKLPDVSGREVYCFGVSFPRAVTNNFQARVGKHGFFLVYDNDYKVKGELAGVKGVKINLKQTAARMAWECLRADFRVKVGQKKNNEFHFSTAPWIVDYSAKKELWRWPNVAYVFVKLAIEKKYEQTLEDWDELASRDLAIVEGQGREVAKEKTKKEENAQNDDTNAAGPETERKEADEKPRRNSRTVKTKS